MFECPKCKTKVPLWKAFFLTNFTKVKCKKCSTVLKPNRRQMERIGGEGTAIGLPIVLLAYYALNIYGAIIAITIIYLILSIITMRITKFEIYEDKKDHLH